MIQRLAILLIVIGVDAGYASADDITTYTFDHFSERPSSTKIVHLRPQDKFNIVIANTCPDSLQYTVDQSPRSQSPAKPKDVINVLGFDGAPTPPNPVTSVTKGPITFDPKYGSYTITIWLKAGPDGEKRCDVFVDPSGTPIAPPEDAKKDRNYGATDPDEMKIGHWIAANVAPTADSPDRFTVAIEADEWEVGADAALMMAFTGDPHFTIAETQITVTNVQGQTSTQTVRQVVEDVPGESAGRITFGTSTHFYFPGPIGGFRHGPTLGFSVLSSSNNQTEYYFGYGFGLGPVAQRLNLSLGLAYTPIATLPAGISIGSQVADASAITNLRNVYRWRFFFGVTATVFRSGNTPAAQKPPAPAGQ
jgi:hypothetical protein